VIDSDGRRLLLLYLTDIIKKYPKKLNFGCIKRTDWGILVHFLTWESIRLDMGKAFVSCYIVVGK